MTFKHDPTQFKHDPADTKPCAHMRLLVSALADNQLSGLPRLFTTQHVKGCVRCQHGLAVLQAMRHRLERLETPVPPLSAPRWSLVEAAWEQADHALDQASSP